jgi:Chalcone isomerase-like
MTTLLGTSDLRFFGLKIYTASLFAKEIFEPHLYASTPLRLRIQYHRALEGKLIAERSLLEMKRIGKTDRQRADAWLDLMIRAFPNIVAGDILCGRADGNGAVEFRHNDTITAQTQDADFASRFFGIWLHEATSSPEMRAQLLGLSKAAL